MDIDLPDIDVTERIFNSEFIDELISVYVTLLGEIFDFNEDIQFPIYVFQKPDVNIIEDQGITKDGIHIIIGLQGDFKTQQYLRKIIKHVTSEDRIFEVFDNPDEPGQSLLKNSFDDVFDNAISSGSNGWTIYGSKKPLNQPYRITQLYNIVYTSDDDTDLQVQLN